MKRTTTNDVGKPQVQASSVASSHLSARSSNSKDNGFKNHTGSNGNGKDQRKARSSGNPLGNFLHFTFIPCCLLTLIPNLVILMWFTTVKCDGSFLEMFRHIHNQGPFEFFFKLWIKVEVFSPLSVSVIFGYSVWALLLMAFVPGKRTEGPMTSKGNIPVYKDNGLACYCITMIAFVLLTVALKMTGRTPTIIYDHLDEFIVTMTIISYLFCLVLYVKGRWWPSTTDSGSSGNFIFDYFWGLELYPRICGIDVKVFTNCRFGMTIWPLLVCIYTLKSYELNGEFVDSAWVSAALQLVYITKFFWWESGYMRTIDIKLDRAGYYICWGCLVYVPGVYASVSMYLVTQPVRLGGALSGVILVGGMVSCALNYIADRQKQVVRRTDGKCVIWGREPEVIRATYRLENGDLQQSLLLVCGFWGIARHFHYVPELILAFLWTVPSLFQNLLPFSYLIYLFFLLLHRTYRDDFVCKNKYKEHWDEYVCRVPYKVIPYIF